MANDKQINFNPYQASDVFWTQLYRSIEIIFDDVYKDICQCFQQNEELRQQAKYNTGSISVIDAINLLCLSHYFDLRSIAEVGTFIGNSTIAMAYGIELNKQTGQIHSCDLSNNISLNNPFTNISIQQFPEQSSTQMLNQLVQQGVELDACYLDGRLQDEDLPLLDSLIGKDVIIALDDFEGMEKGVANLMKLSTMEKLRGHVLIHPPSFSNFSSLPIFKTNYSRSLTAVFIPGNRFAFTRQ